MSSDWEDVCEESGFTANDDGRMFAWINSNELKSIQAELLADYSINLDIPTIEDLMKEHGIDIGATKEYSIADLIFEKEFSDDA